MGWGLGKRQRRVSGGRKLLTWLEVSLWSGLPIPKTDSLFHQGCICDSLEPCLLPSLNLSIFDHQVPQKWVIVLLFQLVTWLPGIPWYTFCFLLLESFSWPSRWWSKTTLYHLFKTLCSHLLHRKPCTCDPSLVGVQGFHKLQCFIQLSLFYIYLDWVRQ